MSELIETLTDNAFHRVQKHIYNLAGISLTDSKRGLVVSRLAKLAASNACKNFEAYVDFLERSQNQKDHQDFINALTTNFTAFHREKHHIEHLCGVVGNIISQSHQERSSGRPSLRIWSAGCSTGQEPYSIALALLQRHPELYDWDFKILATDIHTNVLEIAKRARYKKYDLDGLSESDLKYFKDYGDFVELNENIRRYVHFRQLNLMAHWPMAGTFDAVFCRNVAIYFDKQTQAKLFERLGAKLNHRGVLYLGHSENLMALSNSFRAIGKSTYRPLNQPSHQAPNFSTSPAPKSIKPSSSLQYMA